MISTNGTTNTMITYKHFEGGLSVAVTIPQTPFCTESPSGGQVGAIFEVYHMGMSMPVGC